MTKAIQELEYDLARVKTTEEKYKLIMKFAASAKAMVQQVPTGGIVPIPKNMPLLEPGEHILPYDLVYNMGSRFITKDDFPKTSNQEIPIPIEFGKWSSIEDIDITIQRSNKKLIESLKELISKKKDNDTSNNN